MAATLGLISGAISSFALAVTSLSMALIPLLSLAGRRLSSLIERPKALDPELAVQPKPASGHAIVVGHGRVGQVVSTLLERHGFPFLAVDSDPAAVSEYRRHRREVYFGDATNSASSKAAV